MNTQSSRIQPLVIADEYPVFGLAQELSNITGRHIDEYIKEIRLALAGNRLIVSGIDGEPVGMSMLRPTERESVIEIGTVVVHPNYRNQGIGTAIMNEALQQASNRDDIKKVLIHTATTRVNDWAEANEFEEISEQVYLNYWNKDTRKTKRQVRSQNGPWTAWRKTLASS